MIKILAFAGSLRKESVNKKMLAIAANAAECKGACINTIDLADYSMPLYDADLEAAQGIPESVLLFKQQLISHDGFLIASPEYNSAFSPLLKNAIDWASRPASVDEPPLLAYKGKTAAIMAASPGALGGLRGLIFLRMLLNNMGVYVLPEQYALPQAHRAFSAEGLLIDATQQQAVINLGVQLVHFTKKMTTPGA